MGLVSIISSAFKTLRGAPGKSLVVKVSGIGEKTFEGELFSATGITGVPADGVQGIEIRVGALRYVIAVHNYKLDKALNKGETLIYSIDDDGVIQGQAHFDSTGQIILNAGTKYAVNWDDLNTVLQNLVSAINTALGSKQNGSGSVGTLTLDLSSAKVEKVRL